MTQADTGVADFFARAVEAAGGLAAIGDDRCEAILPADFASAVGCEEAFVCRTDGLVEAGLYYGSEVVERIASWFAAQGRLGEMAVAPALRKSEFRGEIERAIDLVNATGGYQSDESAWAPALFVAFAWAATADEKRQGVLQVGLDEESALETPHRLESLLSRPRVDEAPPRLAPEATRRAFERARGLAAARAAAGLAPFRRTVAHRLARDTRRVREYYDRLAFEARAAAGRSRTPAHREARLAKVPAIEAERERKLADLAGRYAVEVVVRPIAALRVHVPGRRILWEVRRRHQTRVLSLFYDLVAGSLRLVPCEGCAGPAAALWLCGTFHVLCPACRRTCPDCGKNLCPRCDAGHATRHA